MRNKIKKIISICLVVALFISGLIGDCESVFASQTDAGNEGKIIADGNLAKDAGTSSDVIKSTDIAKLEKGNLDIFNRQKLNGKYSMQNASAVVTYFQNEYLKALTMQGTSTEYYDIDFSSYSLYNDSTDFAAIHSYFVSDLYSDNYYDGYDTYEFMYPNRFHMKGTYSLYGNTSTGRITTMRIYYSDYAQYFSSFYGLITDLDNDIRANISSSMTVEEIILTIHDAMIRELNFDYLDYKNGTASSVLLNTAWGTMAGRKGLCIAYAYIFKYYMDMITVDGNHLKSRVVYSDTLGHIWNMVQVNGSWYHIDTSWDDLVVTSHNFSSTLSNVANQVSMYGDLNPDYDDEGYVSHAYFMKTDSEMLAYGYKDWKAYLPISNVVSEGLTPSSSPNAYIRACTNVEGNMPYANGYWYISPADGNTKSFVKTKYDGSGSSTIATKYNVRYLQTDGTYIYYTDGTKLIRTDLDGNNTLVSNVAATGQSISEFAIKDGQFVYMLIAGTSVQRITQAIGNLTWVEEKTECEHTWQEVVQEKATLEKDGTIAKVCTKCGVVESTTVINKIASVKVKSSSLTYNGKARKTGVKVVDSAGKTISSSNYTLKYSNNKNVGIAKVKVEFKGDYYSGTKTLTYNIAPKTTSITSVKAISKGFEIKWKQQKTQTSGYEIEFSTSKKFVPNKTKTTVVNKTKLTSGRAKNLKKKTTYYIRIRTFKTVKNQKIYSSWSKVKSVKTKG